MCFSATASFVASGVLVTGGVAAVKWLKVSKSELPLALIPIIFGVHQFSEGVVWLSINGVVPANIQFIAMHFFNFVAMCFWPIYIPLCLLVYEYPKRRTLLLGFLGAGVLVSLYLLWCFTVYSQLTIDVHCCSSISYVYQLPYLQGVVDYFYVTIVVVPYLVSSNLRIRYVVGPAFFITFIVALAMESGGDYPSIWCFLAAGISVCIYYSLAYGQKG